MACTHATRIRDWAANVCLTFGVRLAALVFLVFLPFGLYATPASAAAVGCRGDPIIVFKNGQSLKITVKIGTDAEQVDSVEYTVHVPEKAKIKKIIYDRVLRDKETVVIQYDAPPNTYGVEAIVHTQVEATVKLSAKFKGRSQSVSGWNEQLLTVTLEP